LIINFLDCDFDFFTAFPEIAECYYELEKFDKSVHYAFKGVRKKPNYPGSYEVLIDVYIEREDYGQALEWAQKWLDIEPDSPDANEVMSEIYTEQERYDLAIDEMRNAIAIQPGDACLYFRLGQLYESTGNKEDALIAYQKVLDWFMDDKVKNVKKKDKVLSRMKELKK